MLGSFLFASVILTSTRQSVPSRDEADAQDPLVVVHIRCPAHGWFQLPQPRFPGSIPHLSPKVEALDIPPGDGCHYHRKLRSYQVRASSSYLTGGTNSLDLGLFVAVVCLLGLSLSTSDGA